MLTFQRHLARTGIYTATGMSIAGILLSSYAVSVATVGAMGDTRLRQYFEDFRKVNPSGRPPQRRSVPPPAKKQPGSVVDDASPTGGMLWEEPVTDNENAGAAPQAPRRPVQMRSPSTSGPESKSVDPFDDVSPAGGQDMSGNASTSQGSAWERLRRGEKLKSIPTEGSSQASSQSPWQRKQDASQKEQQQGSTLGDSFTFSKSEEERSYAKDEAQKEFDARVEKERRGGDFSQTGDQRRW